jgi:hypothetical protein
VLHKVGAAEGDKYRHKPACCALFPLSQTEHSEWYVRQKGVQNEDWDLFCLDPGPRTPRARETLQEELALAAHYVAKEARKQKRQARQSRRRRRPVRAKTA